MFVYFVFKRYILSSPRLENKQTAVFVMVLSGTSLYFYLRLCILYFENQEVHFVLEEAGK